MKDLRVRLEKLRSDARDFTLMSQQATDIEKRELFRLASSDTACSVTLSTNQQARTLTANGRRYLQARANGRKLRAADLNEQRCRELGLRKLCA